MIKSPLIKFKYLQYDQIHSTIMMAMMSECELKYSNIENN